MVRWLFPIQANYNILFVASDVRSGGYCKFGNFREGFIFAKLRIGEVS